MHLEKLRFKIREQKRLSRVVNERCVCNLSLVYEQGCEGEIVWVSLSKFLSVL